MRMRRIIILTMGLGILFLAGCGEKKCFFVTQDSRSVKEGTLVVWEKKIVGEVDDVVEVGGGTRITIRFTKKHYHPTPHRSEFIMFENSCCNQCS